MPWRSHVCGLLNGAFNLLNIAGLWKTSCNALGMLLADSGIHSNRITLKVAKLLVLQLVTDTHTLQCMFLLSEVQLVYLVCLLSRKKNAVWLSVEKSQSNKALEDQCCFPAVANVSDSPTALPPPPHPRLSSMTGASQQHYCRVSGASEAADFCCYPLRSMCMCGCAGVRLGWEGRRWSAFGFLLFFPAAAHCFDFLPRWLRHTWKKQFPSFR